MRHMIKMLHRLTEDQKWVYFSCEENGHFLFTSDLKENGKYHLFEADGVMMSNHEVQLFRAETRERLFSFVPDSRDAYAGTFFGAGNVPVGNIVPVGYSSEQYYVANLYGNQYECYKWAVGTNPCMMFYQNGIQKAMLVEDRLSVNQMYSMTLHIADDEHLEILCMLGMIYHQFENIRNLNSAFHRTFIRNGWCIRYCENVSYYHSEIPVFGAGKAKYDINFLRQFYPVESFPYQEENLSAGLVMKELKQGIRQVTSETWTEENLQKSLRNPLSIVILVGIPVLCGIIGGFIGRLMFMSMGLDLYEYSAAAQFLIGFFALFLFTGAGECVFLLFFKWLTKVFGKKG